MQLGIGNLIIPEHSRNKIFKKNINLQYVIIVRSDINLNTEMRVESDKFQISIRNGERLALWL